MYINLATYVERALERGWRVVDADAFERVKRLPQAYQTVNFGNVVDYRDKNYDNAFAFFIPNTGTYYVDPRYLPPEEKDVGNV
jgi:hypothetical protein